MKLARLLLIALFALHVSDAAAEPQPPHQFVIISDIHFNPLADPALVPQLLAAEPGQWEAIFNGDPNSPIQHYSDDTVWPLLSALVSGLQNVQPKPQLIVLTGDILAHKLHEKFESAAHTNDPVAFRALVKKTFAFVSIELQKASGGTPVIYTLGNNDEECGDYALQPNGPFLDDTAGAVQGLAQIDSNALAKWSSTGSYVTVNPLARHHRIIALNSNFWSGRYKNSCADKSASGTNPGEAVLAWLKDQLQDAQQHGDKIWLVYHIPPGIDGHSSSRANQVVPMWKQTYSDSFYRLLDRYRKTIELDLAGHTHLDDIRLVKTDHTTTLVLINPGVSPNVGQNPAFRVVTVDSGARPRDLLTYYIPNLDAPKWQLEYSARPAYGLNRLDAKSYQTLYQLIDRSPAIADKWKLYYSVSHLAGLSDKKAYLRSLYCATGNTTSERFQACLTGHQE